MRVLVTGGAGFIGSALVRLLVRSGTTEVLTFDKLTYAGSRQSLAELEGLPNHRFVQGDISDAAAVTAVFADFRPDCVMHLAAESHVDRSIVMAEAFVETNVMGTLRLLEAARRHWQRLTGVAHERFRFLHVSTDEVFGELPEHGRFDEDSRFAPSSPYAASKAGGDHLAGAWHRTHGLPVIVSNACNTYGPRQYPEKLIPLAILNAIEGLAIPVYGNGRQVRDWIHVDDHARALIRIAEAGQPGRRYNVGARTERRNIDVIRQICVHLDRLRPDAARHAELIAHVAERPGHDHRYAIDPGRIERELGWEPVTPFDAGLEETVRWYVENEAWWRPLRQSAAQP
jgi:dTDP-glucose 4,6-dehydratase